MTPRRIEREGNGVAALPESRRTQLTVDQYLALDAEGQIRHEYYQGAMIAMTGASYNHTTITGNLQGELHGQLRGRSCQSRASDVRVQVSASMYVYPDVVIACGEQRYLEPDAKITLLNPTVLIEVTSPSTELHDRRVKASAYRELPSLQAFLLIAQDEPRVEVYSRRGDFWTVTDYRGLDGVIALDAIACTLTLASIYDRVSFDAADEDA